MNVAFSAGGADGGVAGVGEEVVDDDGSGGVATAV
jgi:hypothetical protein